MQSLSESSFPVRIRAGLAQYLLPVFAVKFSTSLVSTFGIGYHYCRIAAGGLVNHALPSV